MHVCFPFGLNFIKSALCSYKMFNFYLFTEVTVLMILNIGNSFF